MRSIHRLLVVLGIVGVAQVAPAAQPGSIVPEERLSSIVRLQDVRVEDTTVSGTLVNETDDALENVRLLFQDNFLWKDEFHPGDDDPGQSAVFTVPSVPPRSSTPFRFERSPRPARSDGRFESSVSVLSLVERPVEAARSQAQPAYTEP